MVDEHAREPVADGPLHEGGGHRRVDAAGQPAQHPLVADRGADRGHLLVDDVGRRPRGLGAGDVVEEVLEHGLAVLGVEHLRVELHARHAPAEVLEGGDLGAGRAGRRPSKPVGRRRHRVAVAHPHRLLRRAGRGTAWTSGRGDRERRATELGQPGALDGAAERERHRLEAVADAEGGHAGLEQRRIDARRALGVDRRRAAREDDARPAGGPASPPPASCGGRSRCRRGPRAPGGRSAGRTARRSRRRGPADPTPAAHERATTSAFWKSFSDS